MLLLLRRVLLDLALMGRADHLLGLVAELRGHIAVLFLHLCVRDGRQFIVTRLMRCDLRRPCASYALLVEVRLDLLTPWTGRIQIFSRVPSDLWLATLASFNVIPLVFQPQRQL